VQLQTEKIQPVSASMCAACPEQKTKGQSNFAVQARKTNKIMVASPFNIKKTINMSSLLQPQARKNKIMVACQKNNQPVWPVKLQEKINP